MQFGASLPLFLFLILMTPGLSYAEMYKWIDDQGRVHYGDKPKNKTTSIQVKPVQKHQTTPFKSKKAAKATGLTNEQWLQEKIKKVKSMSAEDIRQHNAEFLRKEEEIKQGYLSQVDEDEARWEEQAKERTRKFNELKKEQAEALRRRNEELEMQQAESRKYFKNSADKRNVVYKSRGTHTGKYFVKDNILIDSTGRQAKYHSDYYDGNGNPINANGKFVDRKGKTISLPEYERNKSRKLQKAKQRRERKRRKALK